MRAVVLVEGISDKLALEALARRRGRDLEAEGVEIAAIGGAQAITRSLARFSGMRLAGLCDAAEEAEFRRALDRAGMDVGDDRAGMEALGFFVCDADLEDELIRAVGAAEIERIAQEQGDVNAFRTLQRQPEWRGQPVERQLRRWLGSGGRRKIRYATLLVEAVDLARVPRPLDGVLRYVATGYSSR